MHDPMSWIPVRLATRLLGLALMAIPLSACALAILHPDRPPDLYGLAFAQTDPAGAQPPLQQPVAVTTWGLGLIKGESGLALSLGWSRLKEAALVNSADGPAASPSGGTVIRVETAGLSYSELPSESGIALGYSGATAIVMAPDALVMGNPVAAISAFRAQ